MKKVLSVLLAALMMLTSLGTAALAVDDVETVATYAEAVAFVRAGLMARQETIRFRYDGEDHGAPAADDLFAYVADGAAGDYLRLSFNGAFPTATQEADGSYTVTAAYYTTAEQEAAVADYVTEVLAACTETNAEPVAYYLYNYLCDNVQFDLENLYDETVLLKYTAYGAVSEGKAVCQGFAQLYYRLARAAGLDCRIVTGTRAGENHAWNIIKIGEYWYHVDAACGAQMADNTGYFMKPLFGNYVITYGDHTATEIRSYPFATASGTNDNLVTGTINYAISYTLDTETGLLTISGSGDLPYYSGQNQSPFFTNSKIKSAVISEGITSIRKYLFPNCANLKEISIPASVTAIEERAFNRCEKLDTFYIDSGNETFYSSGSCVIRSADGTLVVGCDNSVIPDDGSVTAIGSCAFANCTHLTEITIPAGVTTIKDAAFSGCTGLTEIQLPAGVISLSGFDGCTGLTEITIPDSVKKIGNYAFNNCKSLTEITIPAGVTEIGNSSFSGCTGLTEITIPGSITTIANSSFSGCSALSKLTILNGVESIELSAFSGCTSLTEVSIPASMRNIGSSPFSNCNMMERFTVETGNTAYWSDERGALFGENKTHLIQYPAGNPGTSYVIPSSVTFICPTAFISCSYLTEITIPDNVYEIGDNAFSNCSHLKSIELPARTQIIGTNAFNGCSELESIVVASGNSVYHSSDNCLIHTKNKELMSGCQNSVIPADGSVTAISSYAFSHCAGLTEITIPESISSIGSRAFWDCGNLRSVVLPDGLTGISEGTFRDCVSLTEMALPEGLQRIEYGAFQNCTGLTSIYIPQSVVSFASSAILESTTFNNCPLLTICGWAGSAAETFALKYHIPFADACPATKRPHTVILFDAMQATCTEGAYTAGEQCADCGEWLSGHEQTAEPLGHEPAEAVWENVVEPTCTATGSYDNVVRCARCGAVLSSTPETLTMIAHADGDRDGCCDVCGEDISTGNFTTGRVNPLISWRFNNETGELFLSGSGEMPSYQNCEQPFNKQAVTAVTIKDGITSVGESMFSMCYRLTSVSLPDSVTGIGKNAFADCNRLTSITLPAALRTIGQGAFAGCTALPAIGIPDGVTEIGADAFDNCDGLTEIFIPANVVSFGNEKPFTDCDALDVIQVSENNPVYHASGNCLINTAEKTIIKGTAQSVIPDDGSVTKIGWRAFDRCSRLTEIEIPDCVTYIGQIAFRECTGLTDITLPTHLYFIGLGAFYGCTGLREITIPASVGYIDWYPFERCPGIERFTVEEGNTVYHSSGNCLVETSTGILLQGFGNSVIPDDGSVTSINNYAFAGNCPGMNTIAIPGGITKIGAGAFSYCSDLTEIVLPGTVTSIGGRAFSSSSDLRIVIPDSVTDIDNYAFSPTCTIYGHTGSAAETFANEHNIRFMTVCPETEAFHHTVSIDATEATCTEGAYTAGEQCTACGTWLSGHELTAEPLGHRPEISNPERPATCLEAGYTAEYSCSVCHEVLTASESTSIAGHTDENGDGLCDVCRAPLGCEQYGRCGDELFWYVENETLVLTGSGASDEFETAPWQACANAFNCVYIKEGVTAVDGSAFDGCARVTRILAPAGTEVTNSARPVLGYAFENDTASLSTVVGEAAFDGYDLLNTAYALCADHTVGSLQFDSLTLNAADGEEEIVYDILKAGKIVDENHFRIPSGTTVSDFSVRPVSYGSFNSAFDAIGDHPDRNLILSITCSDMLTEEQQSDAAAYTVQLVVHFVDDPDDPSVSPDGGESSNRIMDSISARFKATLAAILAFFKKLVKFFTGK